MRILLTGGAGYLGSTLAPLLLAEGHCVRVIDRLHYGGDSLLGVWPLPTFEFHASDIRDPASVKAALTGVDAVVHLAAIVGDPACARQPELARAINFDASLALIKASQQAKVKRFIFASTCSNYGKMKEAGGYVDENSELNPISLYAETKVAIETELLGSSGGAGWCPTPLRFATVFGVSPRMRFDLTINEFTMKMITEKKLVVFGEQFWRPYIHVRDAARAIMLVLASPCSKVSGRVFNVGATEQNFQKQNIVDLIRPFVPDATVQFVHKNEDPRDYRVSFGRIHDELGFRVTRTVPHGISEVAQLVQDGIIRDFTQQRFYN